MGIGKRWGKGEYSREERASFGRPPGLRLRRDCGNAVWIFEQEDGQLYIAKMGPQFAPLPSETWPTSDEHPPFPPDTAA